MKKLSFVLLVFISLNVNAQFTVDLGNPKTSSNGDYEQWVTLPINENARGYTWIAKRTPAGLMKAMKLVQAILRKSGVDYTAPDVDESLVSSLVKSESDYEMLSLTINTGSSYIKKIWYSGNEYLSIILEDEFYAIIYAKVRKNNL